MSTIELMPNAPNQRCSPSRRVTVLIDGRLDVALLADQLAERLSREPQPIDLHVVLLGRTPLLTCGFGYFDEPSFVDASTWDAISAWAAATQHSELAALLDHLGVWGLHATSELRWETRGLALRSLTLRRPSDVILVASRVAWSLRKHAAPRIEMR